MRTKEEFERALWEALGRAALHLRNGELEDGEYALHTALSLVANLRLLLEEQKT